MSLWLSILIALAVLGAVGLIGVLRLSWLRRSR